MRRIVFAVALAFRPASAAAQQPERAIPRIELGVGAGGAVHPHFGGFSVVQGRVGAGIAPRFGIEAVLNVQGGRFDANQLGLVYTVQGRYSPNPNPGRLATSVTFGATGTFDRYRIRDYRYSGPSGVEVSAPALTIVETLPPVAPTVGIAVHYAVTRRIAVRADAQAVLCPFVDAVGAMVSAGVAIPIPGRRSR